MSTFIPYKSRIILPYAGNTFDYTWEVWNVNKIAKAVSEQLLNSIDLKIGLGTSF